MSDKSTSNSHAPAEGLYSIGDIATATGVRPDTIRSWERKYGRPTPVRRPSGHRRYSEQDMRWLRRVAEALARGHRASAAVGATEAELAELLRDVRESPVAGSIELLELVRRYRYAEIRAALNESWNTMGPEPFLEHIAALAGAVGRAWADGNLEVRHEHFLTALLTEYLHARRSEMAVAPGNTIIVLATLPGEKHALGLQMAAMMCARAQLGARILGPETPVTELTRCARELDATAVAIGVSLASGGVETDRMLRELRLGLPSGDALLVGGAGARRGRSGARGVVYLDSIRELASWLGRYRGEER
jgi:DNA-binding transcriptional MerR regulator